MVTDRQAPPPVTQVRPEARAGVSLAVAHAHVQPCPGAPADPGRWAPAHTHTRAPNMQNRVPHTGTTETLPSCWWTLRLYIITAPSSTSSSEFSVRGCSGSSGGRPSSRPSFQWLPSTGRGEGSQAGPARCLRGAEAAWAAQQEGGREGGRAGRSGGSGPISVPSISCSECTSLALEAAGLEAGRGGACPGSARGGCTGGVGPRCHVRPRPTPTVLAGPLLCAQRADLHFLRAAQRPPGGHQGHSRGAEEAVGSAQGRGAEPAGPGQGQRTPNGQGLHGALWWREEADAISSRDPGSGSGIPGAGRAGVTPPTPRAPACGEGWPA